MLSQQYFAQNGCPQKSLRCWRRNDESKSTLGVFHQGVIAFLTFYTLGTSTIYRSSFLVQRGGAG